MDMSGAKTNKRASGQQCMNPSQAASYPAAIAFSSDDLFESARGTAFKCAKAIKVDGLVNKLLGDFVNWGQRNSPWPLHFGIKCCALEMAAASAPRYDAERLSIVYRSSPRQCDIVLITGPVS